MNGGFRAAIFIGDAASLWALAALTFLPGCAAPGVV